MALKKPRSPLKGPHDRPDQRGRAPDLEQQRVGELLKQDLVSGPAVDRERHLIAHRTGREKDCRLFAEELRDHVLEED